MQISYNVTGAERKKLVETASGILGWAPVYKGAPSFAYVVANVTISRDGTISFDNRTDEATVRSLLEGLHEAGFVSDDPESGMPYDIDEVMEEFRRGPLEVYIPELATRRNPDHDYYADGPSERDIPDALTIEIPSDGFTPEKLDNLNRLVSAKSKLLKAAFGTDDLQIEQTENTLRFPWFPFETDGDKVKAYTHFITAMCDLAKTQQRVIATEKETDNEKYAFRCLLLRLGFIGDEYKAERKFLLSKLTGSSAFKSGKAKTQEAESCTE